MEKIFMKLGFGLLLISSAYAQASDQPVKAWTRPSWGFVGPRSLSQKVATAEPVAITMNSRFAQSLLFDQKNDRQSFLPVPAALVASVTHKQVAPVRKPIAVAQLPESGPLKIIPLAQKMEWEPKSSQEDLLRKSLNRTAETTKPFSPKNFTTPAVKPTAVAKVDAPKIKAPVAMLASTAVPTPAPQPTPVVDKSKYAGKHLKPSSKAALVVIDDEALNQGDIKLITNATISWFGTDSARIDKVNGNGEASFPYAHTISARFIAKADGYIPAVGYVVAGVRTVVSLVSEARLPSVIKSLNVVPDTNNTMLFGKLLSRKNAPMADMTVDATLGEPFKIFYSIGGFGLFHPKAIKSGAAGDFFISGLAHSLQYLMPSQITVVPDTKNPEVTDWPAAIVDLSGVGPVVSHTIQESKRVKLQAHVQDAFTFARPEGVGIRGTIGGQRGVLVPNEAGTVDLPDLYARPSVDLIEMTADRYLTTWISTSASSKTMPEAISLFTQQELSEVFADVAANVDRSKGIVFGNLDVNDYREPVLVKVIGSDGKENASAKVYYFNAQNRIQARQDRTHSSNQNFSVVGLEPGEYHLVVSDAETKKPLAVQVVRAAYETLSQVQF